MILSSSKILCVGSHFESLESVSRMPFVETHKFNLTIVGSPSHAFDLIDRQTFDLYVIVSRLPEMTGVEFCRRLRKRDAKTPILFLTGKSRASECPVALAAGADEYLILPVSAGKILAKVTRLAGQKVRNVPVRSALSINGMPFASEFN